MEKLPVARRPLSSQQRELMDKMTAEISSPDIRTVSFKAEDVLVMLPFSEASSFYALMEDDFRGMSKKDRSFADIRTDAEDAAIKKLAMDSPVTLKDIYSILMKHSGISEQQRDSLMERECQLYLKYAVPRECGTVLFSKALEKNKKIIITSMGVYPRDTMKKILENCGFGNCNIFILHNELNVPAAAETAYIDIVIKKTNGKPSSVLHIGSDVKNDVEAPILKGTKALLIQSAIPLMIRSGRFRGYVQAQHLYEYDSDSFFAFRGLMGLYCCYGFGWPQKKTIQSDFCGDAHMMGFLILGGMSMAKDLSLTPAQENILKALKACPEAAEGFEDFKDMRDTVFGDIITSHGTKGCELPLVFLADYAYKNDRELLKPYLSEADSEEWGKNTKEPELAPVYAHKAKKNALARLADRLFPPETRVRTIVDGILSKRKGL